MSSLSIDDTWTGGYSAASRVNVKLMQYLLNLFCNFIIRLLHIHVVYFYISEICSDDAHCAHIFIWCFFCTKKLFVHSFFSVCFFFYIVIKVIISIFIYGHINQKHRRKDPSFFCSLSFSSGLSVKRCLSLITYGIYPIRWILIWKLTFSCIQNKWCSFLHSFSIHIAI